MRESLTEVILYINFENPEDRSNYSRIIKRVTGSILPDKEMVSRLLTIGKEVLDEIP